MLKFRYVTGVVLSLLAEQCLAFGDALERDITAFNLSTNYDLLYFGGIFVIFMQAGFAVMEGGHAQRPKAIQGLIVNYLSVMLGTALFGLISFQFYFPSDVSIRVLLHSWQWNLLFFYMLMATTITTIVGRIIPSTAPILVNWIIGIISSGLIFPIFGGWVWGHILIGSGWLKQIGFVDFAGASVVHVTAAWIVLAGYLASKSQYQQELNLKDLMFEDYKILSFALACFVLWLGWSGLNIVYLMATAVDVSVIFVNAFATLCGSMITALFFSLLVNQKAFSWKELIKAMLGGLVAITANCGIVSISSAFFIGMVSAILTVYMPKLLRRWIESKHICDVLVVHGLCGIWGTLAVVLTNNPEFMMENRATFLAQSIGIFINFVWSFGIAFVLFKLIYLLNTRKLKLA